MHVSKTGFLDPYRRVLTIPGAAAFSAAGLVARLPLPMTGLGIVLLMQARTGEYAVGGSVSAACTIAGAFVTVFQGRLIDRVGQRRVLPIGSLLYAAALTLLIVGQVARWPIGLAFVFAAVAGGALPPIGSAVRARWSYVVKDGATLPTAFAVESVNDEVVFLFGPLVCTFIATTWHAWSGVALAAVLSVVGTLAFVAQTGTEPPTLSQHHEGPRLRLPWRIVAPLLFVCAGLGVLFGAGEVTTVGFAAEHGHRDLAGVPLALWAFGSMVAGIVTGAMSHRRSVETRVRAGALVLLATTLPLPFVHTLPLLCVFMTLAGLAISPTIVATMSLAEQVLPTRRLTEGIAILFTGMIAGEAPAAAAAGWVIDRYGAEASYWILVGAALLAVLAAVTLPRVTPPRSSTPPRLA